MDATIVYWGYIGIIERKWKLLYGHVVMIFHNSLFVLHAHVNRAPLCSPARLLQQPRRNRNGTSGQEGFRDSPPRME